MLHQSKLQQSSSLQCPSAALGWLDYGVGEVLPFSEVVGPAKGTTMASCPGINSLNFSFFFHCDWRDRDFAVILRYYLGRLSSLGLSSSDPLQNSHPLPWVLGVLVDGILKQHMRTKVLEGSNKIEIWVLRVQFVTPNWNFMDDCKGKSIKIQPIDFSIIWCPRPIMSKWMIPVYPGAPHLSRISSYTISSAPHWGSLTGWFSTASTSDDPKDGEPGRLLGAAWCHSHNKVQLSERQNEAGKKWGWIPKWAPEVLQNEAEHNSILGSIKS